MFDEVNEVNNERTTRERFDSINEAEILNAVVSNKVISPDQTESLQVIEDAKVDKSLSD